MAYSQAQWSRAKFLFELGYSLRDIEQDCSISMGQIGKRSRKEEWKKDTEKQAIKSNIMELDKKKDTLQKENDTLISKVATLSDFEITILSEKIVEETGIKSLITNTQALAVIRANEQLTRNKKTIMLKEKQYSSEGVPIGEEYTPYEVPLDSTDIKNNVDSVDKASITLKVSDRHAPKQVEINNANNQQVNAPTFNLSVKAPK